MVIGHDVRDNDTTVKGLCGLAFKVPVLVKFDMPDPAPSSNSCDISKTWFVNQNS